MAKTKKTTFTVETPDGAHVATYVKTTIVDENGVTSTFEKVDSDTEEEAK